MAETVVDVVKLGRLYNECVRAAVGKQSHGWTVSAADIHGVARVDAEVRIRRPHYAMTRCRGMRSNQ